MEKPTPAALTAFEAAFPSDDDRAARKKMFGMPAGFVNGNMFMGVFHTNVILRVPDELKERAMAHDGVGPFVPPRGRAWRAYIALDAAQWGGTKELAGWSLEALDHAAAMPPKTAKKKG